MNKNLIEIVRDTLQNIRLIESNSRIVKFYHGGTAWKFNKPIVMPTKKGRWECGPGIYMSTSYNRAKDYAGGNKIVQLIEIDANKITLPNEVKVELNDVMNLISSIRIKNRQQLTQDLKNRFKKGHDRADTVINLLVNNEALSGDGGPIVAKWLSDHGITADFNRFYSEEWLIVFDPSIIIKATKVDPKSVKNDFEFDLPMVFDSLKKL